MHYVFLTKMRLIKFYLYVRKRVFRVISDWGDFPWKVADDDAGTLLATFLKMITKSRATASCLSFYCI